MTLKILSATARQRVLASLEKEYFAELHGKVDEIYELASHKWTWQQLADEAGVSYTTVYRLGTRLTLFPRYMTVWKLAKAVGCKMELSRLNLRRKAG